MSGSLGVYFFSFLLAFCSLFYELVYAEVLSVCLGGTKLQYISTIALFTCALGLGSITFGKLSEDRNLRKIFFHIELLLLLIGGCGPFLITWLLQPGGISVLAPIKLAGTYGIIFIIGFLSGFELPLLFALKKDSEGKILAMDYLGMLVATISFPLFFLPVLGTASSTLLIALANGSALVWLRDDKKASTVTIGYLILILFFMSLVVLKREDLNETLSSLYLGGHP